jgi:hypothetical protein
MGQVKFNFDNHILDTDRRELRRGADLVAMQPQVFDLLVHLLKHRDRVVSRDDLIALVWGGRIVSDSTLDSRINAARNAVGDNGKEQRLIRTIPARDSLRRRRERAMRCTGRIVGRSRTAGSGVSAARPAGNRRTAVRTT